MKQYQTRTGLLELLPKNGIIAELGVFKGDFAKEILSITDPARLYLVDIWSGGHGSGDKDGQNHVHIDDMESVYKVIQARYADHKNVKVVRMDTTTFLRANLDNHTENYFDAIYVDADHSYEAVKSDMELSFKKLKPGGFLLGHDYIINTQIKYAVDEFCYHYGQDIECVTQDGCPSFLIRVKK